MPRLYCPGPGDLYLDAIARDEAAAERWLREAIEAELVALGICPKCRGDECEACGQTGRVVVCRECGAYVASGTEQVVPLRVDQPNGPKVPMCSKCAEAGDEPC